MMRTDVEKRALRKGTTVVNRVYDVTCLMCGEDVGEVRQGRFVHRRGCQSPVRVRGGLLRCCHCGGSVYLQSGEPLRLSAREQLRALA